MISDNYTLAHGLNRALWRSLNQRQGNILHVFRFQAFSIESQLEEAKAFEHVFDSHEASFHC